MFTSLCVLALTVVPARTGPAATLTDELKGRLALPQSGEYWVEYRTQYHALSRDALVRSREHYAKAKEWCHVEGPGLDGQIVAFRGGDEAPYVMSGGESSSIQLSEHLELAGPWYRTCSQGGEDADPADASWRVSDPTGVTIWTTHSGRARPAFRSGPATLAESGGGAITLYGRFFRQTSVILEEAERRQLLQPLASGLRALVPMDEARLLDRFDGMFLPNGVMVTPGYAVLEFLRTPDRAQVSVTYRDCLDKDILSVLACWSRSGSLPSSYVERWMAPGAGVLVREQTVTAACVEGSTPGLADLAWRGLPNQRVFDRRFGLEQAYVCGSEGALPDAEVALRTAGMHLQRAPASGAPEQAEVRLLQGATHFEVSAANVPARCPVGSRSRVQITLTNTSDKLLSVGMPSVSCGITDASFENTRLAGQQPAPLVLEFEVPEAGPNEFQVSIPYFGHSNLDTDLVRVAFTVVGEDLGTLEPSVQRSTPWVEGTPPPRAEFEWHAGPCGGSQPEFQLVDGSAALVIEATPTGRHITLGDLRWSAGFGIFPMHLRSRSKASGSLAQDSVLLVEQVPAGRADGWPGALLTMSGVYPRQAEFALPGVELRSAEVLENGQTSLEARDVRVSITAGKLRLEEPEPSGRPDQLASYRVRIDSSIGPVFLFVYSAPHRTW